MSDMLASQMFGAVTVGDRGQIVIPSAIRKGFDIKPGDKLVIFALSDAIRLVRAESLKKFLEHTAEIMEKIKE